MKFELEFADLKRHVVRESLIERCGRIEMHMNVKYQNSYLQSWYLELTTNEYKSQTITHSFYMFEQININLMNYFIFAPWAEHSNIQERNIKQLYLWGFVWGKTIHGVREHWVRCIFLQDTSPKRDDRSRRKVSCTGDFGSTSGWIT